MDNEKKVFIKQISSSIGRKKTQMLTLIGLGLGRIGNCKVLVYNKSVLGMIKKVRHLVEFKII